LAVSNAPADANEAAASVASSSGLEVSGSAGGGNLAVKLQGSGAYKSDKATTEIRKATEKLDPWLGRQCGEVALASMPTPTQPPPGNKPETATPVAITSDTGPRFKGRMGSLEPGISYNQGDLYDRPAPSAAACSAICYNDDRCIAMTWIESQQRCWIKSYFTGNIGPSHDTTSARRLITR